MKAYSTLITNPERRIKFKKYNDDGREYFHVGVWIDGSEEELSQVEKVDYVLHPTFKNRIRSSMSRNNGFSITFWAWGTFEIEVKIYKINGESEEFIYPLHFDLPADNGSNYVDVSSV
jgi:transcription initiation factor IIF auxiliary subunit